MIEDIKRSKTLVIQYFGILLVCFSVCQYILLFKINSKPFALGGSIFLAFISFLVFYKLIRKTLYSIIDDIARKKYELSSIKQINNAIIDVLHLDDLLELIINIGLQVMNAEKGSIMLLESERKVLILKSAVGMPKELIGKIEQNIGEGVAGFVAENGKPLLIEDIFKDERFGKNRPANQDLYKNNSLISAPLIIKNEIIGVININNKKDGSIFSNDDLELLITLANQAAISIETAKLHENVKEYIISVVKMASKALEAKDEYTYGHSERVTKYAVDIAECMNLDNSLKENLRKAGLLHDIGKIGVRESVLLKPGKLTDEEFAEIKSHPTIGFEIIESMEIDMSIKEAVLHHHERYDGWGYPDKQKGEDISILSRILCVADSFDAMSSNRPYRKSLPPKIVIGELKKNSGTQFDPAIVEIFLKILQDQKYYSEADLLEESEEGKS